MIIIQFLIGSFSSVSAEYNEYISDPGNVGGMFSNFKTKDIEQGTSGEFKVTFKNLYELSMNNVSLTFNIYGHSTHKTNNDLDENFKNPPIIEKARSPDTEGLITPNSQTAVFNWNYIENNVSKPLTIIIKANPNTPEGRYFIRFELKFRYSGMDDKEIIMRSRGYIDDEDWQFAMETGMDHPNTNHINLTHLGIDGLLPDSSIKIIEKEDKIGFIPSFELIFLVCAASLTIFIIKIQRSRFFFN